MEGKHVSLCMSHSLPPFSVSMERSLDSPCTSVPLDINEEDMVELGYFRKSCNNSDLRSLNSFFDKRRNSTDELKMLETERQAEEMDMFKLTAVNKTLIKLVQVHLSIFILAAVLVSISLMFWIFFLAHIS